MKIDASSISLAGSRTASTRVEEHETLRAWIGDRRPDFEANEPAAPSAVVSLSPSALLADLAAPALDMSALPAAADTAEAEAIDEVDDVVERDPMLRLLKLMIEILTGKEVRVLSAEDLQALRQQCACDTPHQDMQQAPQRAGYGIEYDRREVREEYEQTRFAAEGVVHTADGKEIRFQLALTMERSYREESSVSLRAGDGIRKDPLVINFDCNAAQLQSVRFRFDLDGDGEKESVPLLTGNRGYLALDLNGNGRIDSGKELFGAASGDGFAELAHYDSDANGWIDEQDAVFNRLLVWMPAAGETAGQGSLAAVQEHGVGALYLGRIQTPFELRDGANAGLGAVRSSGVYLREDGSAGSLQQIDVMV